MQAASQHSPAWADLQPELLLHVARLLGNEDRLSLMHTCGRWYTAIAAGPPEVWPAVVLTCPPLEVMRLNEHSLWPWDTIPHRIRQAINVDMASTLGLITRVAKLPSQTLRVCIQGEVQPMVVVALLMAMPSSVRCLELAITPCAGPLLPALARFSGLQRLTIASNGADIQWSIGPAAVLAALRQLSLDYRRMPVIDHQGSVEISVVEQLPLSAAHALSAATNLHSLDLRLMWSGEVEALVLALPALRCLRLQLYGCTSEHADAAVQLLHRLPQLSAAALGTHSCPGSELDVDYPDLEVAEELTLLPALAGLTALTELCLAGWTDLPPDLRQLSHLQHLVLVCASDGDALLSWGTEPLASMTSLTRIDLLRAYQHMLPDPAVLASAPRLQEVHGDQWGHVTWAQWRAQLAALRPDVHITAMPPPPLMAGEQEQQ